jgi:copper transport protein
VQSLIEINAFGELLHTGYGRAVLIKFILFCGLLGFGYVNRNRILPALRAAQESPGRAGVLLRRSLRLEMGIGVVVLGVTGALATYAPAKVAQTGPVDANAILGPARLELTVDPARSGINQIHLYLFERKSGVQWTKAKQLTVTATQAKRGIDLPIEMHPAGPGHYVAQQASLPVKGDWKLKIIARVSEFDEYTTTVKVPVR